MDVMVAVLVYENNVQDISICVSITGRRGLAAVFADGLCGDGGVREEETCTATDPLYPRRWWRRRLAVSQGGRG